MNLTRNLKPETRNGKSHTMANLWSICHRTIVKFPPLNNIPHTLRPRKTTRPHDRMNAGQYFPQIEAKPKSGRAGIGNRSTARQFSANNQKPTANSIEKYLSVPEFHAMHV